MFLHRLALGLGRTVTEIEECMSARELDDWRLYYAKEPWGALRDNMHAGIIAAEIRAPRVKRGKKAPTFNDFMLRDRESARSERRAGTPKALAVLRATAKRKNDG